MENSKHNIQISDRLYKEIKDYCEINSLKLNSFIESILKKQLAIEKYGDTPFFNFKESQIQIPKEETQEVETTVEIQPQVVKKEIDKVVEKEENKEKEVQKPKKKVTRLN